MKLKLPKNVSRPSGSEIKVPKFAKDLYADLRDRRLLPLVAVLLVGIVAAPILLKDKDSHKRTTAAATAAGSSATKPTAATFSVVPAQRELRDYRKRLGHRQAKNPFDPYAAAGKRTPTKEDFERLVRMSAEAEAGSAATASIEEAAQPPASTTPAGSQSPTHVTIKASVEYAVDVNAGYVQRGMHPVKKVEPQTKLPTPKSPVVVFTGLSSKKDGALFLMSNSVTAFYGAGKCVLGGNFCQMLELKPGQSETFAIGSGESRYKLHLQKIVPIVKEATTSVPSGH